MALDPPSEVVTLLGFIGINWPMIDEDAVREVASAVESFAADVRGTHQDMTRQIQAMEEAYQGASYDKLVSEWESRSGKHMTELMDASTAITDALKGLADVIVVQKGVAIGQLVALAASFLAAQAAAPETFGLSEVADLGIDELANKAIGMLKQIVLQYIEGQVIEAAFKRLGPAVERALEGWVFNFANGGAPGANRAGQAGGMLMVDGAALRSHAAAMRGHAQTMREHAERLNAKLAQADFT